MGIIKSLVVKTPKLAVTSAKLSIMAIAGTAKFGYKHKDKALAAGKVTAGTVIGVTKGATGMVHDTYSFVTISKNDLLRYKEKISQQTQEYMQLTSKAKLSRFDKDDILDTTILCGNTLAYYFSNPVPEEIVRAYELQFPIKASCMSFVEAAQGMEDYELAGFISSVKGKLFEIRYLDYLNDGNLPSEYTASLAQSATQTGWDIQIAGPDGDVSKLIQLKATNSVEYIRNALEHYPDIDVVSTSEVYSHLVMRGLSEQVIDGGMTNAELHEALLSALDDSAENLTMIPLALSAAIIAFSAYSEKNLSIFKKSLKFGERITKFSAFSMISAGLAAATPIWWLGLIPSIGGRYLLSKGKQKHAEKSDLENAIRNNEKLLEKLRTDCDY